MLVDLAILELQMYRVVVAWPGTTILLCDSLGQVLMESIDSS
jgi:hypothetical protein